MKSRDYRIKGLKDSCLAALLMAGAAFAACSGSEDIATGEQPANPTEPKTCTLTVQASKGDNATTRALDLSGTPLNALWEEGEKVDVYTANEITSGVYVQGSPNPICTLEATNVTNGGMSCTLTGSIDPTDLSKGQKLFLKYMGSKGGENGGTLGGSTQQDGSLQTIADYFDRAHAVVTISSIGTSTVTTDDASFVNEMAIVKFTLKDAAGTAITPSSITIQQTGSSSAADIIVSGSTYTANSGCFYFAFSQNTATGYSGDIEITATVGSDTYTYTKAGTSFAAGQFYPVTVKMVKDLSATGNANTYIVSSAGKYRFDATVKGNGGLDPMTGTTATKINKSDIASVKVLWELYGQGRAIKHDGTSYDISYDDGYVYFSTPSTFVSGNCHVAVVDASDNILWSWLIWATPEPGEQTADSEKFMDRNLGSINVEYCTRGFLYQWGRKDPFPSTQHNSANPYYYVPVRMTCHGLTNASQSVSYTILHPTTYIYNVAWVTENDYKANLWSDTEKTIYDPCPAGWRVPTNSQMATFHSKIGLGTLPDTGFIGDCSFGDFGYGNPGIGYYWSSTGVNKSNAKAFCNDARSNQNWPINEGYAIRPVKE